MLYGGAAIGDVAYGGMTTPAIRVTATDSFMMADSAVSLVGKLALDSWVISDSATRAPMPHARAGVDSFTISDLPTRVLGRRSDDSWPLSDGASATVGRPRLASDGGWTFADSARRFQAQMVDLPARLTLQPGRPMVLAIYARALALDSGSATLQLKPGGRSLAARPEKRTLALKDESEKVLIDG